MKNNQKLLKNILLLSLVLCSMPTFATLYEDAEDNTTIGWISYGDTTDATIENVNDTERGSQVIQLIGNGKETGFRLGNRAGRASYVGAWHNQTEKLLQWSMKYDEPFRIYISITTELGNRYLTYTNQSIDKKGKVRGEKIHYGLGEDSIDGTWHTFTRDLEEDWNRFEPDNPLIAVNGFFIRGSGRIDDISLLEKETSSVYEDAEDNDTTDWIIYGDIDDATVESVKDIERGSQVIKLTGNGEETGYRLGNRAGRGEVDAWNNTTEKKLQWSMKYDEDFRIYVSILTEKGNRYLTYTNQSTDNKGKIRGGKVHYGLGEDSIDGTWHTFTRDLEEDWSTYEPDNPIISVNGFFIRGSGYIDDIIMP